MISIYIMSLITFVLISGKALKLFKLVSDKNLGYEEIITISIIILSCINIYMDSMNLYHTINGLGLQSTLNKTAAIVSRLFQALVTYSILQYMNKTYSLRVGLQGEK